ncbi:MAG: hypothetical protein C3F18_03025 [Nitrosomonadales bacterium]|nr:MAG: hypothetical protein C3F18_03025 [Nitrosomonadales bacterium]
MSMQMQAQMKPTSTSTSGFTSVRTGLLQRKCARSAMADGECEERSKKKQLGLQTKLKVNEPGDIYEREADRIADQMMATPAHQAVSGALPRIQRLAGQSAGQMDSAPASVDHVLASPGMPLEPVLRHDMEQRFGHDFSQVRVHADAKAAESARAVNALAYTLGQNVVFGTGGFQPNTSAGRQLLAHELTHVVQQSAGAVQSAAGFRIDPDTQLEAEAQAAGGAIHGEATLRTSAMSGPALQRQPRGGSGSRTPRPAYIRQIVVNQTTHQRVTATFSNGHTESDECSTGKGHCCFDDSAGTAEGGACSAARSTQVGNNCTPVGDFTVTAKIPVTASGVNLWTQFHNAKSVALHEYKPVDGTPLSHGCVRLNRPMAQIIFDGSRVGITRVRVENLARPLCQDTALQNEWSDDFTTAGSTPPDGETVNPFTGRRLTRAQIAQMRHSIQETRQELRSAIGVDEAGLDIELAAVRGGASIVSKIPRCVPALTREEQQVPSARSAGFLTSRATNTAAALMAALNRARTAARAEQVVRQAGERLWQNATASARAGGAGTDDRQLYWTRLMLTTALRRWNPSWVPNADALRRLHARLLNVLEQTSRGMTTSAFPTDRPDLKRILISGFDPFGFPNPGGDIRQSNLSGAAAMALDGEILTQGSVSARVEAVVFPVRYADFNEGVVENHLRPHLTGPLPPHLVMSISQGDAQFEFEEWAGRRRSTENYLENLGQPSGGTQTRPIEPLGLGRGPEFLRHTVPSTMLGAMRGAVGRTSAITEETRVIDLPPGATQSRVLPGGPGPSPGQAVEGSGGGFLSNEIFYRNSLLRTQLGSTVPMIHLHTPMLEPGASDTLRNTLIDKIREILRATLPYL